MTTTGEVRGYRTSQKVLHWLTVLAVAAQFTVGYNLDLDDDCDPAGEDRSGGDTSDAEEELLDRLEDLCETRADDYDLLGGGFDLAELPQDQPVFVICQAGGRSRQVVDHLRSRGIAAINVAGGTGGWRQRGWPLEA